MTDLEPLDLLLERLRAAAEETRLRLLVLCADSELTVSDLTAILGQSQPRVSRHLKVLCDAGLLERFREGSWAFFRLSQRGLGATLARSLVERLSLQDDQIALDLERLHAVKQARAESAARYFDDNAADWDRIRVLHVAENEVEAAVLGRLGPGPFGDILDIGTGTGRLLELMAPRAERAIGLDLSREMLALARANLDRAGLKNCSVRQGDLYALPFPAGSFDAVTLHQVLHFLEDPAAAVAEAARVLRPGGKLIVVDFAPHDLEELRDRHAHRRLGFPQADVDAWTAAAGLDVEESQVLPGKPLTVILWSAQSKCATPTRSPVKEALS
ncbi:ArsR family transcriptional regulator [Elstera cyanobacteriorum]|uniref:ArsR family transcriptional regulator n=1 Tax=Elstera cyanobacteriorum TaxID=2022747 RepID=A0A255XNB0_9PROT|nr:metalloregulator ArsR/SmtB family transcription factor [Elstera cyanobacteriorum]OYQ18456.1 ArsR family transcriptional regulator [Elstera cyanobacteriorum]GFZ80152.1 ArsR family transcriptional regulator [Elstera cyanobacteriorum]